jgi:hypothetical protein
MVRASLNTRRTSSENVGKRIITAPSDCLKDRPIHIQHGLALTPKLRLVEALIIVVE